jgi:hypothetical protein
MDVWLFYWVCLKGLLVVLLSMLKGVFGCITTYAYRDVWFYYWVCLTGCLAVILSVIKGMFGYITEYALMDA